MTARELFELASGTLEITGMPEWDCPDAPGERDVLTYCDGAAGDEGPLWVLAPTGTEEDEYVSLDTDMAQRLIESHLRAWLLERGWQVQVAVRRDQRRWRLVDCLSIADGGGDRLDADYSFGDDELSVLCESVVAVSQVHYVPGRRVGF